MEKNLVNYVNVCLNNRTQKYANIPASSIIIALDADGNPIRISDILEYSMKQDEKIKKLESAHNDLVSKYNTLLSAYKASNVKTELQLLDLKGNV